MRKHHGYEQPTDVAAAFAQVHRADVVALLKRSVLIKCCAEHFNTSAVECCCAVSQKMHLPESESLGTNGTVGMSM